MVRRSMSKFFKGKHIRFNPEVTPGICPYCELTTSFVSIVSDQYRCMNCGADVKQEINGVIKYLPIGSDKIEDHGA